MLIKIKSLLKILALILISHTSIYADLHFKFTHRDKSGTGFHANPEAKAALDFAAAKLGSYFENEATIHIKVYSFHDNEDSFGKTVPAFSYPLFSHFSSSPGFHPTSAMQKAVIGDKKGFGYFDADLYVNLAKSFFFGDFEDGTMCDASLIDFQALIMHELVHILGFVSQIQNLLGDDGLPRQAWTYFDQFVINAEGNFLINSSFACNGDPYEQLYFFSKEYRLEKMDPDHAKEGTDSLMMPTKPSINGLHVLTKFDKFVLEKLGYKLKKD